MKDYLNPKVAALKPSGIRRFFGYAKGIPDCVALSVGEPDFDTPWHISEAGVYSIEKGYTFYTANNGLEELREEVCAYLKRKFGLEYEKDEVLATVGGSEAIDLAFRALVEPGDEVIMTNPGYVSYEPCATLAGAKVVFYELEEKDGFKIKADKFEKLITPKTKILMMNYPNNPTGAIMEKEDLAALAEVCVKHDILVITDEIYGELTYGGKHCSIAGMPGMKERTLLINGFSKAYSMTGWRLGYVCAPKEILNGLYKIHQFGIMCASTASQFAGIEALRNGDGDIEQMKEEYEKRRNFLMKRFKELGLQCYEPKGAFYCFVNIAKYGKTSEEFCLDLLQKEHVIVIPGSAFGTKGEGFVRISYAYSLKDLKIAMDRIERYLNSSNK